MASSINRTPDIVKSDSSSGRIRETGIFVGIVKGNVDPQRMGRLSVYIPEFGGDPESETSWYIVSYASPFAGATNLDSNKESGPEAKKMDGTQKSYGFWAVPPDLNNEVLVCFANGDTTRGFWFGCLFQQFMNHMVPGVALNLSTDDSVNKLNLPPVCEYNRKDDENAAKYWDPKRPIFEPLYDGLREQGLFTDAERGPGTSSARREAPSKVYGMSTPRGHNFHFDEDEKNEFIRLRTRSGVQLLLHETTGYIYMISKKGNSWMEISDEGINMYSKGSINMRAEGGINSHTDAEHRQQAAAHHTRATGNSTVASEGNHTHETQGNRTTTTDGNDARHAATTTRNSNQITDARDPQRSSLSQANSTTTPGSATRPNAPTQAGDRRNDRNGLSSGMSGLLNNVENKFGPQFVTSGNSSSQRHGDTSDHNWNINAPADAVDLRTRNMSSGDVRSIANYVNSQPGGWALIESDHLHISYRGAGNARGRTRG